VIYNYCDLELAANCAMPHTASAGQYAALNCKPLLFGFPELLRRKTGICCKFCYNLQKVSK